MPKKIHIFSDGKRRQLILYALANGVDILALCNNIAENFDVLRGSEPFCAGLYTHALEEYGKILWLQSLPVNNGTIEIDKSKYESHKIKFNLIKEDKTLPDICKKFRSAPFDDTMFDSKIFDSEDTYANQFTRFQIFYSDFNDDGELLPYPSIDTIALSGAIKMLSDVFSGIGKNIHDEALGLK